jgi:UDP-glucose 4-epimerase
VVAELLHEGHQVCVLDNFSTGYRSRTEPVRDEIELVEGDIRSYERVSRGVKGCELVLHLAALPSVPRSVQDPLTTNEVNVTGTLNVLLAARDSGVRRVVMASSSSVYGAGTEPIKLEDQPTLPVAPYAVSKLAAECYARSFHDVYGLETVALRYFNVFGPGQDPSSQYAAVIPKFIKAAHGGEAPVVFGDGEQTRDFTYVANAVQASLLALTTDGISGEVFNVACGQRTSINEVLREIGRLTGSELKAIYDAPRAGEIRHSLAGIDLARRRLGYEPRVSVRDGLRLTVEAFDAVAGTGPLDALTSLPPGRA